MIPNVGATCSFTFISKFASLNGVYTITTETTFLNAVSSGINFVTNLYTPAGLSQSDYNADYSGYTSDRVAVLQSVTNSSIVYYVPESIFQTVPDPTINEYYSLVMVATLGVYENTQAIYPLLDNVKDLIQAQLGVTDPVRVVTNPSNKIYLTDAQYQQLVTAREANISTIAPWAVQLEEKNKQITYLQAKVASYEALLAAQAVA